MSIIRLFIFPFCILCLVLTIQSCKSDGHVPSHAQSEQPTESKKGKATRNEVATPNDFPSLIGNYPAYAKNAILYEVNLKQYNSEGTFNAFVTELPRLKEMGIDILLLTPMLNPSNVLHVNPEMGSIGDLRKLVRAIHKIQMKVVLTIEMDESQATLDAMQYWVSKQDVDGYYLTNGDEVAQTYWTEAASELRKIKPDILLIAEGSHPDLKNSNAIDVDTADDFYKMLVDLAKSKKKPKDVVKWQQNKATLNTKGFDIHYTSTSKLNSSNGPTIKTLGPAHDALAVMAYTIGGMPLMTGGQEEPVTQQIAQDKKGGIKFGEYLRASWYQTIFKTKHMNQALWNGKFGGEVEYMQIDDQILSYKREKNGAVVYCLFNLSNTQATFVSNIEVMRLQDIFNQRIVDLYQGSEIPMEPWSYRVFSNY